MSDALVYIIVTLGAINLFPLVFSLQIPRHNDSMLSASSYYKVWHIENLNILGKVLLTIIITPFTILAELLIWCVIIGYSIAFYIGFRICWLFAVDRDDVVWEWLGYDYIGKKHKFILYVKEYLDIWR